MSGFADRELAPYTKSVLGVDISQGMVNQYNKLAESQGFSNKIKAVCGELKAEDGELDGAKFDVVLVSQLPFLLSESFTSSAHLMRFLNQCTMAYHHFESINDLTKILAFFLKPGGSLMVADKERPSEKTAETVVHAEDTSVEKTAEKHIGHAHGFTEEDIKSAFEGAGLKSVSHEHVASATPLKGNGNYPDVGIFLAQAVKPAAQAVDHSACPCGKTHPVRPTLYEEATCTNLDSRLDSKSILGTFVFELLVKCNASRFCRLRRRTPP